LIDRTFVCGTNGRSINGSVPDSVLARQGW
jgi:hypothetical protein